MVTEEMVGEYHRSDAATRKPSLLPVFWPIIACFDPWCFPIAEQPTERPRSEDQRCTCTVPAGVRSAIERYLVVNLSKCRSTVATGRSSCDPWEARIPEIPNR